MESAYFVQGAWQCTVGGWQRCVFIKEMELAQGEFVTNIAYLSIFNKIVVLLKTTSKCGESTSALNVHWMCPLGGPVVVPYTMGIPW